MESLRCFCRDLYVVTTPAALGLRQLSCAGVAEEGAGHMYSSPGTRQTLGHGTAEKQPWEKRIPGMLKPRAWLLIRESFTLRAAKALWEAGTEGASRTWFF